MVNQVIQLSRLQLINLFGINELRYTKDKAKRARYIGIGCIWLALILMVVGYVGGLAYGLIFLGLSDIVPLYLYALASLLILVFSFFKAGSILFSMKGYEILVSLPVTKSAIVISRFFNMYITNLLLTFLIMLPGMVIYGYFEKPSIGFYGIFLLSSLFLPLLPLTVSSILGAGITAISSRMKHKNLVEIGLTLLLVIGMMAFSMLVSDKEEMLTADFFKNLGEILSDQIGGLYPPALWFSKALAGEKQALIFVFIVPAVIFTVFVLVLQKYFQAICTAIHTVTAKNDYQMTSLRFHGQVTALWKRELKRYFSSSVYVTNTIIGYIMAVILAVGICIMGVEHLETMLMVSNMELMMAKYMPLGLSCLMTMTSTTSCSISLEGKTVWHLQTLPITKKQIFDSKILTNLTVAVPFYILSVIFLAISVKLTMMQLFWLITIPAAYLLFACVLGLTINLAFPVFDWENEVRVVKQSMTTSVSMLIGMLSSGISLAVSIFVSEEYINVFYAVVLVGILVITGFLYQKNNKN